MRLLFLSAEYPPETDWGGQASHVAAVAQGMAFRGHDVHVLSCVPGQRRSDCGVQGVAVHRRGRLGPGPVPGRAGVATLGPAGPARFLAAMSCWREARLLGFQPDIVEAPDWLGEGLFMAGRKRPPVVTHLHTPLRLLMQIEGTRMGPSARMADALEAAAVRACTIVTAPSRMLLEALRSWGALDRKPVRIVPPIGNLGPWAAVPPASNTAPVVLFVGRLEARKGADVLVDAAARLAPGVPGLSVVFLGRSSGERGGLPFGEWLEARARALGAPCSFPGHVDQPGLASWLTRSRVVAVPSTFDAVPLTALEAMAAGRPVVCTERTGIRDLLDGQGAGAVVPAGDAGALAEGLRPYLTDAVLADTSGRRGRQVVAAATDASVVLAAREDVYTEAIDLTRRTA